MNSLDIWNFIKNNLDNNKCVTLLTVAESSASSPGRQGFKMAVAEDAEMLGTIGGGIMEKDMVEFALEMIFTGEISAIKRLHHSNTAEHEKSGLICGGRQTVLLNVITKRDITIIENLIKNINKRIPGKLEITHQGIHYSGSEIFSSISFSDMEDKWKYTEQVGFSKTAYIVGGGHIGLATSRIMKSLGFYVVVFDHREDVFTLELNEYADEKVICEYCEIGKKIVEGDLSYVIIATPMHAGDSSALKSVIDKKIKYIGLMGSKRKLKTIFDTLLKSGVNEELFKKVHAPIGIEIEAETPEEIAVSIAAEIIKIKNTQNNF